MPLQSHGCPFRLKLVDHAFALESQVFVANDHDHSIDRDRSAVFKKPYREAMDEIIGRGGIVGAKRVRAELARMFGEAAADLPTRSKVPPILPACLASSELEIHNCFTDVVDCPRRLKGILDETNISAEVSWLRIPWVKLSSSPWAVIS